MHIINENRQTQNTEDNRRHRREIRDIHLDDIGQQVLGGEFFKVDRRGDPDGQRQRQHHQHHKERAKHRDPHARRLGSGIRRIGTCDEIDVKAFFQRPICDKGVHQIKLLCADAFVVGDAVACDAALHIAIDAAVGQEFEFNRGADELGVIQHKVTQLCRRILGQDARHILGL